MWGMGGRPAPLGWRPGCSANGFGPPRGRQEGPRGYGCTTLVTGMLNFPVISVGVTRTRETVPERKDGSRYWIRLDGRWRNFPSGMAVAQALVPQVPHASLRFSCPDCRCPQSPVRDRSGFYAPR